jgi:AbrB family looped-hinge helix DNA binding protein
LTLSRRFQSIRGEGGTPSKIAEANSQIPKAGNVMPIHNGKWHGKMGPMTTTLTLDKAGRVVLPKPVRDELQLRAGDSLELESSEDRIVLRPRRGGVGLHQKQGIWVFSTGEPISAEATDETLQQMRREREQSFLGNSPARSTRRKQSR